MLAEKILRKHVAIIHAYSLMSVLQRKIVNVLLFEAINCKTQAINSNSISVECVMPFSRLSKAINFNSNNSQYLKEAIDGLASLTIEWNLLKDKAPNDVSFLNLRILHGSPTFYQNGSFNFSFHKFFLDLIGSPTIYGSIDVELQSQFESKYSHSLYENSTRFVNLNKNKIIQLDTFRKLLGIGEEKYSSMRELTRNAIKPSIEEVNDRAEFVVDLQNIRSGKKITGFEISVEPKKKISAQSNTTKNHDDLLAIIKNSFGKISEVVLENISKNYSKEYILEKITYTKEHAKSDKSGFYPIPYFISALRDDYRSIVQSDINNVPCQKNDNEDFYKKLSALQADLEHWQQYLMYAKVGENASLEENTKKIIQQCEENLSNHLLLRPKDLSSREVG